MSFASVASLPSPLPLGVTAEGIAGGVCVTFVSGRPSLLDRRVWVSALVGFVFPFAALAIFFGGVGAVRAWLLVLVIVGAGSALCSVVSLQMMLAKRRSGPAKLELTDEALTVEEPGFNYVNKLWQRLPRVGGTAHMTYALAEVSGFAASNHGDADGDSREYFESTLQVCMTNRLTNYHLRGRSREQVEWACRWLSEALRTAELHGRARSGLQPSPQGKASFIYDQSGPHT